MNRLQATLEELKEFKRKHIVDADPYDNEEQHYLPPPVEDDSYPGWAVLLVWAMTLFVGMMAVNEAFHLLF